MNMDQLKGDWKQLQGKVKTKWGKLTDDDMTVIEGKRDELAGKIQERYGMAKEAAQKELDDFCKSLS
ncbi:CsbD family protein [soil metagenome]